MGYRSDVAIGFQFKDEEAMMKFATVARLSSDEDTRTAIGYYRWLPDKCVLYAKFEGWKWYESYPEVIAHEALLAAAQGQDIPTARCIIGEDYDDVRFDVVEGTGEATILFDLFDISRTLICPDGGELLVKEETDEPK